MTPAEFKALVGQQPKRTKRGVSKIPRAPSEGEESFALQLRMAGVPFEREFQFNPLRKWKFDFCFPKQMLAIEIDGGIFQKGRHSRGQGIENDMAKLNNATILGWRILRYTPQQIKKGTPVVEVMGFLSMLEGKP